MVCLDAGTRDQWFLYIFEFEVLISLKYRAYRRKESWYSEDLWKEGYKEGKRIIQGNEPTHNEQNNDASDTEAGKDIDHNPVLRGKKVRAAMTMKIN